jgi:DNA (cytosine-5)-methyltransferase 1
MSGNRPNQRTIRSAGPLFLDLFAGCGGMSLGLERAGWRALAFTEINEDATASYLKNRQSSPPRHFATNVELQQHASDFKHVDLVCGGPPCQGFSFRGQRRTQHVRRDAVPANALYKEMIAVIARVKPKMFLFENVYGMVRSRWNSASRATIFETVYEDFIRRLSDDYVIAADVLRSCDYAVPQLRRRVFLVGINRELRYLIGHRQHRDPFEPQFVARALGLLPQGVDTVPFSYTGLDPVDVIGDLVDPAYDADPDAVPETATYPHEALTPFQQQMRMGVGQRVFGKGESLRDHAYSRHRPETRQKYSAFIKKNPASSISNKKVQAHAATAGLAGQHAANDDYFARGRLCPLPASSHVDSSGVCQIPDISRQL